MKTTNWKMSLILRTGILQRNENKFHEISSGSMKDGKEIVVETGSPGSGECYMLMAKMPYFYCWSNDRKEQASGTRRVQWCQWNWIYKKRGKLGWKRKEFKTTYCISLRMLVKGAKFFLAKWSLAKAWLAMQSNISKTCCLWKVCLLCHIRILGKLFNGYLKLNSCLLKLKPLSNRVNRVIEKTI